MHGGATWNSTVNRDQIRDCGNLLGKLVPLVIEIMMDNVDTLWATRATGCRLRLRRRHSG